MSEKICPTHNREMKERKGVSERTGRPYHFWSCPVKDEETGQWCGQTWREPTRQDMEFQNIKQALMIINDNVKAVSGKIDKFREEFTEFAKIFGDRQIEDEDRQIKE